MSKLRVLIAEDEKVAADRLIHQLHAIDPSIEVIAVCESVEELISLVKDGFVPDLMFLDIQLSDGSSFQFFEATQYKGPVVFITAYDQYALEAFNFHSIHYILKPVTKEALNDSLQKFKQFSGKTVFDYKDLATDLKPGAKYKSRILGRIGQKLYFLNVADISFFEADNKIVSVVDQNGNKYLLDSTLEKLEQTLNPSIFFRANRSILINLEAIEYLKPYFNNRLRLYMKGAAADKELVVSRDKVSGFKQWAEAL